MTARIAALVAGALAALASFAGSGPIAPAAGLGPIAAVAGLGSIAPVAGLGPIAPAAGLGPIAAVPGLGPAAAIAQEPGTEVGGSVPSYLKLGIDAPATLAAFPAATGVAQTTIGATVTATESPTELSIADGDTDATARRGHLVAGARMLGEPLQAAAGSSPFQPLDDPLGPLLMRWSDVLAGRRTVIRLRQRVTAAALRAGPYSKTVLVTASTQTP